MTPYVNAPENPRGVSPLLMTPSIWGHDTMETPSLSTPSVSFGEGGLEWPSLENLEGDSSGLFDLIRDDPAKPTVTPNDTYQTPGPVLDLGDMDFSGLDSQDLDRILQETTAPCTNMEPSYDRASTFVDEVVSVQGSCVSPPATEEGPCLLDSPTMYTHAENEGSSERILRTLSHDHDYCDKNSEDWSVLTEFLNDLEPLQTNFVTRQGSITAEGFSTVIESTMKEDLTSAYLQTDPSFMDTSVDLSQYLGEEPKFKLVTPSLDGDWSVEASGQSSMSSKKKSGEVMVKDEKYWERRHKNNVASVRSRMTRKQRREELKVERTQLTKRNLYLKAEIERLESMTKEWKSKLLETIAAK